MKRFWDKVDIKGEDDCWYWLGGKGSKYCEYGMFWNSEKGRMEGAHRVAYRLTYGEFDNSYLVCHRCNHPGCCNPNHLYLGDKGSNATDCKGNIGRNSRWSKEELLLIRKLHSEGKKQVEIGNMFKVNQSTISDILRDPDYPYIGMNRYELTHT